MRICTFILFMAFSYQCYSQTAIRYTYDAAGNRVKRSTTVNSSKQMATSKSTLSMSSPVTFSAVSDGKVTVAVKYLTSDIAISIYNMGGVKVSDISVESVDTSVNLDHLPKGVYLIHVMYDSEEYTYKVTNK